MQPFGLQGFDWNVLDACKIGLQRGYSSTRRPRVLGAPRACRRNESTYMHRAPAAAMPGGACSRRLLNAPRDMHKQALDGFDADEAECRELVHALSGPASSEAGPSFEGGALIMVARPRAHRIAASLRLYHIA